MIRTDFQMFIDYQIEDYVDFSSGHYYGGFYFPRNESYRLQLRREHIDRCGRADCFIHARNVRRADLQRQFKEKIRYQMASGNARPWRFQHLLPISAWRFIKLFKEAGELHPARREYAMDDLIEIFNSISNISYRQGRELYNKHFTDAEISFCSDCGSWYPEDDFHQVIGGDPVCSGCVESYNYSECMGEYLASSISYSVYDSYSAFTSSREDDYCTSRYGDENFFLYDGSYFSNEEAYYEACDDEDSDRDDDDRNESGFLRGYHNAHRDFTEINASEAYPALGLELEVYAEDRCEAVEYIANELHPRFIFERDGSLDDYCGFEMVSKPFGREEWIDLVPKLTKLLHDQDVVGFNEPAGSGYGIHVTIHRRHFSPLAEARIAMFLATDENEKFVKAVAQRDTIYGVNNGYNMGSLAKKLKVNHVSNSIEMNYNLNKKKISGKGKYCPINWKESLAEFRIFQSTTNPSSIMKNFEFVWALHAWTKEITGSTFNHRDFVAWLNTHARRKEFPFLYAFLSKNVFYGTNYPAITSTWQDLFTKPSEQEAVEPVFA